MAHLPKQLSDVHCRL